MTGHRHEAEEILDTLDQYGDAGSMARCERVEVANVHALLDIADRLSELVPDPVSYYPEDAEPSQFGWMRGEPPAELGDLPEIEAVRRAQEDLAREVAPLRPMAPSADELTAAYFDDLTACTRHTAHRWDFASRHVVGGNTTDGPWEPCDSVGIRGPVTFRYHDMDTQAGPLEPPVPGTGVMYAIFHPDPDHVQVGDPVTVVPVKVGPPTPEPCGHRLHETHPFSGGRVGLVEPSGHGGTTWEPCNTPDPPREDSEPSGNPFQPGGSAENAVLLTLVDEMVNNWHTRPPDGQELRDYLGMTHDEYDHWILDPDDWATTHGTTWFKTRHLHEPANPTRNATPDETPATPTGKQGITPDLEGCVTHQAHWESEMEACDAVVSDPYLSEHARGECRRPVRPTSEDES